VHIDVSQTRRDRVRILLLCEGDAETWDSWSGLTRSVVSHLRSEGHVVICGDVDVRGFDKYVTALKSFSPTRQRWWVKYHLGPAGFRSRSRRASKLAKLHASSVDVVLQIGASFQLDESCNLPFVLYCDSNIELAREGSHSGFSEAATLRDSEVAGIRAREAEVYARARHIFTISDKLRRVFVDRFNVAEDRLETVHAGPNFELGDAPEVPARNDSRSPVILFIGRAFHRKGGDVLVQAFKLVREQLPEAQLLVIGPDELPDEIRQAAGVEFLGFVDKGTEAGRTSLQRAYERATVFCLPTRFEPFGVVFLEAMYFALPCVGPNAWAVPEIISDGITGSLVPPEDPRALAATLLDLLTHPQKAAVQGLAGKKRLHDQFTWTHVARRISSTLERMFK